METYRGSVIRKIKKLGQSYGFAIWALGKIDLEHYRRKYESHELAELLVFRFAGGSE